MVAVETTGHDFASFYEIVEEEEEEEEETYEEEDEEEEEEASLLARSFSVSERSASIWLDRRQ